MEAVHLTANESAAIISSVVLKTFAPKGAMLISKLQKVSTKERRGRSLFPQTWGAFVRECFHFGKPRNCRSIPVHSIVSSQPLLPVYPSLQPLCTHRCDRPPPSAPTPRPLFLDSLGATCALADNLARPRNVPDRYHQNVGAGWQPISLELTSIWRQAAALLPRDALKIDTRPASPDSIASPTSFLIKVWRPRCLNCQLVSQEQHFGGMAPLRC